jgi:23S rRNA (cytosine1962-C5)-methyltransferase
MLTLRLRPREHQRIADGHLWIFRDELKDHPTVEAGTLVSVESHSGRPLGSGFYHPTSKIAVRLLGGSVDRIDAPFMMQRIQRAWDLRRQMMPDVSACRVVFGEADLMSGLIVDRFGDHVVVQMMAAGMDRHRDLIYGAIRTVMPDVKGIVERNTMATRKKEGLELREGVVWGTVPEKVRFEENNVTIETDLVTGQKTGYFLDQRVNRAFVRDHAKGKRVLDCFCNIGGFALNAAVGGASLAVGVDSSDAAVEQARINAQINGLENCRFEKGNVFDVLHDHAAAETMWDMVILDPPSFAKNRKALDGARAGYAEINRQALRCLAPGGWLVSSSCTQLISEYDLMDIIYREAARAGKRLRLLHRGQQASDHPVLLAMPETMYLKFLVFDVVDE